MNARARVRRLEKAFRRPNMDPERISGALAFLWSGRDEDIPDGLNLAELQTAALMIHADRKAAALGLTRLREALGDKCGGDVLGYIARAVGGGMKALWAAEYGGTPETEGDRLLVRLGFLRIYRVCYKGDADETQI